MPCLEGASARFPGLQSSSGDIALVVPLFPLPSQNIRSKSISELDTFSRPRNGGRTWRETTS